MLNVMSFIQFGSFFSTIKTRTRKAPSLFSRLGWLFQPHYLSTQTPKIHPRARSKTQGLQQPLGPGSRSQHSPWQAAVTDTSHHPAQHHSGDEASIKRNISTNPAHPRASRGSASFRGSVKQHQPAGARLQVGRNKPGAFFFLLKKAGCVAGTRSETQHQCWEEFGQTRLAKLFFPSATSEGL